MEEKIKIESPCTTCGGTGKDHLTECRACHGKGKVLTPEGKRIIAFLKDSIRLNEH